MSGIDWSVLSGPRVSRRTLMSVGAASGAVAAGRLVTAGAAHAAPRARQEAKQGGTLTLGFGINEIPTLDPAQDTTGIVAGELISNLFSGLIQFDTELGLQPDLAETWEVSADGLQYTFHLRDGLAFHNGDPLTAEDVIFTYQRTTDESFASPHANKLSRISEITAPDELTLSITLSAPHAPFLPTACSRGPGRALTPVPRSVIEEMGNEQFGLTPVGCGPFMLVPETVEPGGGFEMVAFDDWYAGRPFLDKIVVRIIPEISSRVSALEAGDIDMLDILPAIGVAQVQANDQLTIAEAPGTNWFGVRMNFARPPWDNPDARLAVAKAIDRQAFIETAFLGLAVPGVGPLAPAFGWVYRPPDEVETPQAYNIEEARTLAEQAGLAGAQPQILIAADDTRPAEVLVNILTEIGMDAQVDPAQTAAYFERWGSGDYDMNITGSVVDADPDDGVWNFFHSQGPWNSHGYANAEADELLEAERTATAQEERTRLFQELQTVVQRDTPFAFLYHEPDRTTFSNDVKGYVPIPEQRYLESVWLDR